MRCGSYLLKYETFQLCKNFHPAFGPTVVINRQLKLMRMKSEATA
jgi:hypothetical protein